MLTNVQSLRALAALSVVFVHLADVRLAGSLPPAGRGGVDLFFVISGFIMVHISRERPVSAGSFLIQRVARVAPLYWTMTLLVFGLVSVAPQLFESTRATVPNLLRSLAFIPYVKANGLTQPMLFVGWTLNYEMLFYGLFVLGLLMPDRRAGLLLTSAMILALVLGGMVRQPTGPRLLFYTSPMLLEFLAGMALGLLLHAKPEWPAPLGGRIALVGTAIVAAATLLVGPLLVDLSEPVVCGIPATILVFCALRLEAFGWRVTNRLVLQLGNASYSLYLTHPFVIQAIHEIVGPHPDFGAPEAALLAVTLLAVGAVGWACHRLIERPLSAWALDRLLWLRAALPSRIGRAGAGAGTETA